MTRRGVEGKLYLVWAEALAPHYCYYIIRTSTIDARLAAAGIEAAHEVVISRVQLALQWPSRSVIVGLNVLRYHLGLPAGCCTAAGCQVRKAAARCDYSAGRGHACDMLGRAAGPGPGHHGRPNGRNPVCAHITT